ncbi:MAG TPA: hypothetical protein DCM45_05430 [Clostridiales bacterium]|nr:hypothetical protein [Clostridiales bacterium]
MSRKLSVLIALLLIMTFTLTACSLMKPKTVLTPEDFQTKMEAAGLAVEDATDQFEEETLDLLLIAYNDDFQIEFYVMDTDAHAEQAFAGNVQNFEELSGVKSTTKTNGSNYNTFVMTLGEQYAIVSRVDNTFIYIDEQTEDRDAIKELMKTLGY